MKVLMASISLVGLLSGCISSSKPTPASKNDSRRSGYFRHGGGVSGRHEAALQLTVRLR